jgi:hypothetical protein
MRVEFDLCPAQCPHCGAGLDVAADCADDVIEVTCERCKRTSTFENALYRTWLRDVLSTIEVAARTSRFAHATTWAR